VSDLSRVFDSSDAKLSPESTAMLNGYFEEWCVLTENVANEAFNIQDGLNFTWGKFW